MMRVVEDEDAELRQKRKNKLIIYGVIIAIILIAVTTYYRNTNHYYDSLTATLRAQQQSSGYIVVEGNSSTRDTKTMVELLKIYGFTPTVEEGAATTPPFISFGEKVKIDLPTLIYLVKRLPVQNFHDGHDDNNIIVYGVVQDKDLEKARTALDDKNIMYQYVDIKGEDPNAAGVFARLIVSGYDPEDYQDRNFYLEYRGKVYPADEALKIINKM